MRYLQEHLNFNQAKIRVLVEDAPDGKGPFNGKNLYMEGICIEGGVKNANERVYPVNEIAKAVDTINKQVVEGYSVMGEVDHPENVDGWALRLWQVENYSNTNGTTGQDHVGLRCQTRSFEPWFR